MTLTVRLEKLKFLVEEMQIALRLTCEADSDFTARVLARHVLVRAENFIEHARGLRRPLTLAGHNTREFHKSKEFYARTFDEYFTTARDRLGAHVQDLDFGRRIELWNDIEDTKIRYFVDGAKELYEGLAGMNVPGYVPYAEPAELSDPDLTAALAAFRDSIAPRTWAEMGADPLAMTRPNTSAMLNTHPLHARAGQLALIRRWMTSQEGLLEHLSGFPNILRIIKTRMVTDLVSFCDCLVTRPVTAGAPQAMDGLNNLLVLSGHPSRALALFLSSFDFAGHLSAARSVRDQMGAHLEIDPVLSITQLVQLIDASDFDRFVEFFEKLKSLFQKICFEDRRLIVYATDGLQTRGMIAGNEQGVAYRPNSTPPPSSPQTPRFENSDAADKKHLQSWLTGESVAREEAFHYFQNTFMNSEPSEVFTETEDLGGGNSRSASYKFTRAHRYLLDTLSSKLPEIDFSQILDLLIACKGGDPRLSCEILTRYLETHPSIHEIQLAYTFGELASWPHNKVQDFLRDRAASSNVFLRFHAMLALFKIFVRTEGIRKANGGASLISYATAIAPLAAKLSLSGQLFAAITFGSQFCKPEFGHHKARLQQDYDVIRESILDITKSLLPACFDGISALLEQLLNSLDYVGACLLLADHFAAAGNNKVAEQLLDCARNGVVICINHNQAIRHLACCHLRRGDHASAVEIAASLAHRNPDEISLQLFHLEILIEAPGLAERASEKLASIKSSYQLSAEQMAILSNLESRLQDKLNQP